MLILYEVKNKYAWKYIKNKKRNAELCSWDVVWRITVFWGEKIRTLRLPFALMKDTYKYIFLLGSGIAGTH